MKKKIFPKKWYLYILEALTIDWNSIYKIWCTSNRDINPRKYYANRTYWEIFTIKNIIEVNDMYKEENLLLRHLRSLNYWVPWYAEIFLNCYQDILFYISKKKCYKVI